MSTAISIGTTRSTPWPPSTVPAVPAGSVLDESHTITNSFQVGPDYRWSSCIRHLPALQVPERRPAADRRERLDTPSASNSGIFDTLLPQHDHIVEVGFNWFPCDWFMFNACMGIERGDNHSQYANFDEENYPMSFNAWYAVSQRWSLSAGYAVYSNFVGQDITVADQTPYTAARRPPPRRLPRGGTTAGRPTS